jgi:UDP-glucose 4-epimerase
MIGGCGYIGSALYPVLLAQGHTVQSLDLERRGNPSGIPNRHADYASLTKPDLRSFDAVILLAAHASVAEANEDPSGAFLNNVVAFHSLLEILGGRRFIYASSSSVYTGRGGTLATELSSWMSPTNMYDFSKFVDDGLAALSDADYYGLRFGTVNGPSANLRDELMLNRMVHSALVNGEVQISSGHVHRPILALKDLTRAIIKILEGDGPRGVYNLASFNTTVQDAAGATSRILDVPIRIDPPRQTYDFTIDTAKFQETYGFTFLETIDSLVRDLVDMYEEKGLRRPALSR